MLSLLAIHFHTNQISSAIELIRETLGHNISFHSESLNQVTPLLSCISLPLACSGARVGWRCCGVLMERSFLKIAAVFTEDLFTEEVVAKEAVALAVRPKVSRPSSRLYVLFVFFGVLPSASNVDTQLSDKDTKSFAVMCIYHLLKNKIFSKHRVDVGEWVWSQITQADEPVHYLLPALIEEWVKRYASPPPTTSARSYE
jgi:hypothetical protein